MGYLSRAFRLKFVTEGVKERISMRSLSDTNKSPDRSSTLNDDQTDRLSIAERLCRIPRPSPNPVAEMQVSGNMRLVRPGCAYEVRSTDLR